MNTNRKPNHKPDLNAYDFTDSVAQLRELDATIGLLPTHVREHLNAVIDDLAGQVAKHELSSLRQVVDHSARLIGATSGVNSSDVSRYFKRNIADSVHQVRNLLLAIVLIGAQRTLVKESAEALCAEIPTLKPRGTGHTRPNADDEMVLLRVWAYVLSHVGGKHGRRSAAIYAQCDAGLVPGETTCMRCKDVHVSTPGKSILLAPGLQCGIKERIVPLDNFQRFILGRFIADLPGDTPLAPFSYKARAEDFDYARAAASATGVIDRQRAAVGLQHADTTASSVPMWRALYTEQHHGIDAAVEVSGRSRENHKSLMRTRLNPTKTRATPSKKVVDFTLD